jgi:hypothetical protein
MYIAYSSVSHHKKIMKFLLFVILFLIGLSVTSQVSEIPNIKLTKAKIKSIENDTTSVGGLIINATKYTVQSKTKVATRLTFTGEGNRYKMAKTKIAIYHVFDSSKTIRDSIYCHIKNYWIEQEKWLRNCPGYEDSISLKGDFRYLPINEGFYNLGSDTIPFISPNHGRNGTYEILYFKNHFYKIVLLESQGAGGMGFIGQNMTFFYQNVEYPFIDLTTKWMDEIRLILDKK